MAISPLAGGALGGGLGGLSALFGSTCLTGTVVPRPVIGISFAGTHLLLSPVTGRTIASLRSNVVNLDALVGRTVTVCGPLGAPVEGVPVMTVVQVLPSPSIFPFPFGQGAVCFLAPTVFGLQLLCFIPGLGLTSAGGLTGLGGLGGLGATAI